MIDYKDRREDYKKSIEILKDKICTVEYDNKNSNTEKPYLVCLAEDEHEPKWLFSIENLIKIDNKI